MKFLMSLNANVHVSINLSRAPIQGVKDRLGLSPRLILSPRLTFIASHTVHEDSQAQAKSLRRLSCSLVLLRLYHSRQSYLIMSGSPLRSSSAPLSLVRGTLPKAWFND